MIFDELRVSGMICTIPTERKSPDGRDSKQTVCATKPSRTAARITTEISAYMRKNISDTEFIHCQVVIENIIREMYEKEKKK